MIIDDEWYAEGFTVDQAVARLVEEHAVLRQYLDNDDSSYEDAQRAALAARA